MVKITYIDLRDETPYLTEYREIGSLTKEVRYGILETGQYTEQTSLVRVEYALVERYRE